MLDTSEIDLQTIILHIMLPFPNDYMIAWPFGVILIDVLPRLDWVAS